MLFFPLSRTSSLPSLWNSRKDWGKTRQLHPLLTLSSSSIPASPVNQLSKSAPVLINPLLHASGLLQARANIQNSKYNQLFFKYKSLLYLQITHTDY